MITNEIISWVCEKRPKGRKRLQTGTSSVLQLLGSEDSWLSVRHLKNDRRPTGRLSLMKLVDRLSCQTARGWEGVTRRRTAKSFNVPPNSKDHGSSQCPPVSSAP